MGYGLACGSSPARPSASVSPSGGGVADLGRPVERSEKGARELESGSCSTPLHVGSTCQSPRSCGPHCASRFADQTETRRETDLVRRSPAREAASCEREDLALRRRCDRSSPWRRAAPRAARCSAGGRPAGRPRPAARGRRSMRSSPRRPCSMSFGLLAPKSIVMRLTPARSTPARSISVDAPTPFGVSPSGVTGQREPHLERPIGRRLLLEGSDRGGPPHVRRSVVERGPLDVEIDHARLVPIDDRAVRSREGGLVPCTRRRARSWRHRRRR